MFGKKFFWNLTPAQQALFKSRKWFRGKPFRMHNGKAAPNGTKTSVQRGEEGSPRKQARKSVW